MLGATPRPFHQAFVPEQIFEVELSHEFNTIQCFHEEPERDMIFLEDTEAQWDPAHPFPVPLVQL